MSFSFERDAEFSFDEKISEIEGWHTANEKLIALLRTRANLVESDSADWVGLAETARQAAAALEESEGRRATAISYLVSGDMLHGLRIEKRSDENSLSAQAWCITDGFEVLNRDGEWEWEPNPSSRTDGFVARTRYTLDEAFGRAGALDD